MPDATKLPRLHEILQLLFNWEGYHLHEFVARGLVYGIPDPNDQHEVNDERRVPLSRMVDRVGDSFDYVYDFGDDWRHDILLDAILLPTPRIFYPQCIAGARNGPPEDAGGSPGYAYYLKVIGDPAHKDHEAMLAWHGPFDPDAFSVAAINASLNRSMPSRRKKSGNASGGLGLRNWSPASQPRRFPPAAARYTT